MFGYLDYKRKFATGISSGGYMTSRMAVSYAGSFIFSTFIFQKKEKFSIQHISLEYFIRWIFKSCCCCRILCNMCWPTLCCTKLTLKSSSNFIFTWWFRSNCPTIYNGNLCWQTYRVILFIYVSYLFYCMILINLLSNNKIDKELKSKNLLILLVFINGLMDPQLKFLTGSTSSTPINFYDYWFFFFCEQKCFVKK